MFYCKYGANHLVCGDDIAVLTVKDHIYMSMDKIRVQESQNP